MGYSPWRSQRVRCDSTHTTLNSKQVPGEHGVEMWIYFTVHPSSSALLQAATDLWLGDYLLHSYENKCLKKDHNQSSEC